MRTAHLVQDRLPRFQPQMVGVIQAKHASGLFELVIRQALEGRLRRNRHKDRKRDRAMRKMQSTGTSFRGL